MAADSSGRSQPNSLQPGTLRHPRHAQSERGCGCRAPRLRVWGQVMVVPPPVLCWPCRMIGPLQRMSDTLSAALADQSVEHRIPCHQHYHTSQFDYSIWVTAGSRRRFRSAFIEANMKDLAHRIRILFYLLWVPIWAAVNTKLQISRQQYRERGAPHAATSMSSLASAEDSWPTDIFRILS